MKTWTQIINDWGNLHARIQEDRIRFRKIGLCLISVCFVNGGIIALHSIALALCIIGICAIIAIWVIFNDLWYSKEAKEILKLRQESYDDMKHWEDIHRN